MPRTLVLTLLLAACGRASSPPAESAGEPAVTVTDRTRLPDADARPDRTAPAPTPAPTADAPASAEALAELLGARHAEDLPDRQILDAHPDAEDALAWLAEHHDRGVVQVRATRLLGLYPGSAHAAVLDRLAGDGAPHPTVQAAALDALAAWPVAERQPHRATIEGALGATDPRVQAAATRAAEGLIPG